MRIVLDLQACQTSSTNRGIGRYSMALTLAMLRQGGQHDLRIALNHRFPDTVAALRQRFDTLLPQTSISAYELPAHIWEHQAENRWRLEAAERLREHYLASLAPDVVHISSLFEGMGQDACVSALHGSGQFDTAITLYDLIPLVRKETYLTDPHVASWYYRKLQSVKNAELLLAISGHSRQEALEALQLAPERVVNISSAVDDIFLPRTLAPQAAQALLARYGLRRGYIMYTGGIDYRKNIEGLIEAYAMLPAPLRQQYQLAVVCSILDVDRVRLQALAARHQIPEGDLVLTGFVPDDDLVSLYNLTALFVFPSLQEGFGLPALEAMQCGVPVIGSNNSSIPEVIGRADALFDPNRFDDISAKMAQVLQNPDFGASLRAHGLVQARQFSWDASARKALEAFEQLHARRQADSKLSLPAGALSTRRPRLAYLSPLPPERSGIADYSAELLPELARHYEIEVIVDQPEVGGEWLVANFPRRTLAWFEANSARYDRIVYHFGNSSFHAHMFALLQRHPGVVVLHDFFLSGAVNYLACGSPDPQAYSRALFGSHGYAALLHDRQHGREASIYEYPCNKPVLDHASGVIVHSQHSRELAARWYGPRQSADWQFIPHLRVLPNPPDRQAARAALGIADGDFLLCSFGLMGKTKYNDRILDAWLASPLAQDARCHLVFVGENSVGEFGATLTARIARARRIKITGFASVELYRQYLAAADAAVQLRTRSRGETSGTVLDCLAYRVPLIINGHGSAAELPDQIMLKVPDQFEPEQLRDAMLSLYQQPDMARQMAGEGAAYLAAQHHPARIGDQYRDAIERFSRHSPRTRYRELLDALGAIDCGVPPADSDWLQVAASIGDNGPGTVRQLLVDIGALEQQPDADAANQLRELLLAPPPCWRVEPVRQHGGRYQYARRHALALLGLAELGLADDVADFSPGDHLLRLRPATPEPDRHQANRGVTQSDWHGGPLLAGLRLHADGCDVA
ncbi:glycosyltransferase [Oxalobacteraceae bacterium]|nr:glycosyltransferase [Oxalobacteraceae bacterium]